ncbi:MAG: hypothetical protein ACI9WU_002100, partial [Myxococcota bacterium]
MVHLLTVLSVASITPAQADVPEYVQSWGVQVGIDAARSDALAAFHTSLRATQRGEKKTRILQFGASHTAADLLTGYMRRDLQKRFGSGGHGWFMPARPWKTYRHQDLVFENSKSKRLRWQWDRVLQGGPFEHPDGMLGLAGMTVRADNKRQWAKFRTARTGPNASASHLELWYATQPGGGDLYLKVDNNRKRKRIRTRGKNNVLGFFELKLEPGSHRFELKPKGNGETKLLGAVLENDKPGVVLDTLGINGSRARSMLVWDDKMWRSLVARRDPALVILAYGTNESGDTDEPIAVYERNLRKVLRKVRKAAPSASCVLFGPTDRPVVHRKSKRDPRPWFSRRERTAQIVDVQRKVSREAGCGFFDAVAATGGTFSIVSWAHAEPR